MPLSIDHLLLHPLIRCGTNYESADEALESAATNVNVHSQWAVDAKTTRGCKRDVYKVLRGPGGSDPERRGAIHSGGTGVLYMKKGYIAHPLFYAKFWPYSIRI